MRYDEERLDDTHLTNSDELIELNYKESKDSIKTLKDNLINKSQASELFATEKGRELKAIFGNICQSFDSIALYN